MRDDDDDDDDDDDHDDDDDDDDDDDHDDDHLIQDYSSSVYRCCVQEVCTSSFIPLEVFMILVSIGMAVQWRARAVDTYPTLEN